MVAAQDTIIIPRYSHGLTPNTASGMHDALYQDWSLSYKERNLLWQVLFVDCIVKLCYNEVNLFVSKGEEK